MPIHTVILPLCRWTEGPWLDRTPLSVITEDLCYGNCDSNKTMYSYALFPHQSLIYELELSVVSASVHHQWANQLIIPTQHFLEVSTMLHFSSQFFLQTQKAKYLPNKMRKKLWPWQNSCFKSVPNQEQILLFLTRNTLDLMGNSSCLYVVMNCDNEVVSHEQRVPSFCTHVPVFLPHEDQWLAADWWGLPFLKGLETFF